MGIRTALIFLVLATEVADCQAKADSGFGGKKCNTTCKFILEDQWSEERKFSDLDLEKVQMVFLSFNTKNETQIVEEYLQGWVWVHSHSSQFLFLGDDFEIYSLTTLSPSVSAMTVQASFEPKGCFHNLTEYCRNFSVASVLLNNVTQERGAVCFRYNFVPGITKCCELRNGAGLECDITVRSNWEIADITVLNKIMFCAILFVWPLFLFLLPETPDGTESQVPLITVRGPNPISLSNVFVRCFCNQPEHGLRDKMKRILARMTVFLGLFPSLVYLYVILYANYGSIMPEKKSTPAKMLRSVPFYIGHIFTILIVPFIPVAETSLDVLFNIFGNELVFNPNWSVYIKNAWKWLKSVHYSLFSIGLRKPVCDHEQNKCLVYKTYFICFKLIFAVFRSICTFVTFGVVLLSFYFEGLWKIDKDNKTIGKFLILLVIPSSLLCSLALFADIASFVTYTVMGLILNYKIYLPTLSAIVLVLFYVFGCYSSAKRPYDQLRKLLFKACLKRQKELDRLQQDNGNDLGQQQQLNPTTPTDTTEQAPQLIYEKNGTLLIPKKLFEDACDEIMPFCDTIIIVILKMVIISLFIIIILNSVLTLTRGDEYSSVSSAVVTFCAISIPRLLYFITEDEENKKLEELKIAQHLKRLVKDYRDESNLTDITDQSSSADVFNPTESESTAM